MKKIKSKDKVSTSRRKAGFAFISTLLFFLVGTVAVISGVEGSKAVVRSSVPVTTATTTSILKVATTVPPSISIQPITKAPAKDAVSKATTEAKKPAQLTANTEAKQNISAAIFPAKNIISFPFAVQAGEEGVDFINGYVEGDMYSSGPINGCGTCVVSGKATSQSSIEGTSRWELFRVNSAQAHSISYVSATTSLICSNGVLNNRTCDISRSAYSSAAIPAKDSQIVSWKNSAARSIQTGNYQVNYRGATLGPQKIVGNLYVTDGGVLRLSGPVWVTGRVYISDGATVVNNSLGKSSVIISDNPINLSGGSNVRALTNGNVLIVSTSLADPAITVTGGTNNTILFAPKGGVLVEGGAKVMALYGNHVTLDEGSSVIYDRKAAGLDISSN